MKGDDRKIHFWKETPRLELSHRPARHSKGFCTICCSNCHECVCACACMCVCVCVCVWGEWVSHVNDESMIQQVSFTSWQTQQVQKKKYKHACYLPLSVTHTHTYIYTHVRADVSVCRQFGWVIFSSLPSIKILPVWANIIFFQT